jgi:hypothetical protein
MGQARRPPLVLLIVAVFSRHPSARAWAEEELEHLYGPVCLASLPFDFTQTRYYEATMGSGLRKQFLTFGLMPADCLATVKRQTDELEARLTTTGSYPEERPLNLDPGILTLGKFLLATTKDQAHRIYLRDGIFAEVTLRYQGKSYEPWPWTYADYRQAAVLSFFNTARVYYRGLMRDQSERSEHVHEHNANLD